MPERPNILYLHSHDTGRAIEPMGYPVSTPNLMKLAEEGVTFRKCFCANPTCSPSRAALITGRYPHTNGMIGLVNLGFCIGEPERALPNILREKGGYKTALAGAQHVVPADRIPELGYDEQIKSIPDPDRPDDGFAALARGAVQWIQNAPAKQPFFLAVGFNKPHWYQGPMKDPRRMPPPPGMPDTPETREHSARLHAGIEVLDRAMGLVLDALEKAGLAENTLVVSTTDHGLALPHHKCNLTDGGLGVFSIWRGPGGFTGGEISDAMVSHIDFYPTLCKVADIAPPEGLEGVSLLPLVNGESEKVRDLVFGEINYHASYEPQRCVRTERWKYIRRFDSRTRRVLPNCDPIPSKQVLLDHGWIDEPVQTEALYDLVFDPQEKVNLLDEAGQPRRQAHAEPLKKLRGRLAAWMRETDDPLLHGQIVPPMGGEMIAPDSAGNNGGAWNPYDGVRTTPKDGDSTGNSSFIWQRVK